MEMWSVDVEDVKERMQGTEVKRCGGLRSFPPWQERAPRELRDCKDRR